MKSHENTFPKNDENCHRFMPSFVVACGVGISIDSHLLTFHCGEVSAAHPGISDEWRLPQIWCFSQYLPMGSFGKPRATLPSRIPLSEVPSSHVANLPATMRRQPCSDAGPPDLRSARASEFPMPPILRDCKQSSHLSPILHPPSPSAPGGQQGGKL